MFKINNVESLQVSRGCVSVPCWLDHCSLLCYACKYLQLDKQLSCLSSWKQMFPLAHLVKLQDGQRRHPFPPSSPLHIPGCCAKALHICCKEQGEQADIPSVSELDMVWNCALK